MVLVLSDQHVSDILASMSNQTIVCGHLKYRAGRSPMPLQPADEHKWSGSSPNTFTKFDRDGQIYDSIHAGGHFAEYRDERSQTSVKVVSVPKGGSDGLPATTLTFDAATGKVDAIVNSGELTGVRTAAASALSLQVLLKRKRRHLVIFGSGTQAYYHARFLLPLMDAESLILVGRNRARLGALLKRLENITSSIQVGTINLSDQIGIINAIKQADVICLCTPSTRPLFQVTDLKSICHVIAIGSYKPDMVEFDLRTLMEGKFPSKPTVMLDSKDACLHEAGELAFLSSAPKDIRETLISELVEIGTLVDSEGAPITTARVGSDLTVYKSVGNGAMDVAITFAVVEQARRKGFIDNAEL